MPIECTVCNTKKRTVHFRSYSHYPRQVKNLWWLVLASALIATYNAGNLFIDLFPLLGYADEMRSAAASVPPDSELGQFAGDVSRFFTNMVNYLFLVTTVVLFYLPIRYGIILKRFRRGAPPTYWSIRNTAWLTIGLATYIFFTIIYLFSQLATIYVAPPLGLNILIAPLILLQMRRREVREYFSQFEWEALKPIEPVAATFLPEGPARAQQWERVD